MTPGLPGTGLGGFYYILLVAFMPVRETYLTLRGRSSMARWKIVGGHLAMTAGILAALAIFAWVITVAFNALYHSHMISPAMYRTAVNATGVTSKLAAFISVSVLASLLLGGCLLRVLVGAGGPRSEVRVKR